MVAFGTAAPQTASEYSLGTLRQLLVRHGLIVAVIYIVVAIAAASITFARRDVTA